ncbi:MAG: DUF3991 domain-containing protein [Desulfitobacteriaceae bacterium]
MTTEDGTALKDAVTFEVENEAYTELQQEYDWIAGQLSQLEAEWSDKPVPDEISAHWNGLHDRQQDIEETLYDEKPYKSFVQSAVPQTETEPVLEPVSKPRTVKINFRYSEDYALYPNGVKTKYKNNVETIKLLNKIESEKRFATTDEQIVLARYVGWGGLANAFSDTANGWEKEYHELKHLLDEKEYADALNSVVTAYYTEPELITRIYKAFESFGFTGGEKRKILDPAMGTGNFFSVLPESYEGTPLYGVELDSITGRIARQLYQTANIQVQGFETTRFEDNSFDIAIGNIPFNNIKLYDKRYDNEDFLIHDYFIAKSLDLVKPGGIIGFITSKGTMDKKDTSVREYIARRADLIGAIRLPNTAFKALAGTEVTADILFFQKLESQRTVDKYFLPDKAANFKRAYWYLVSIRGIAPEVVSLLMNERKIYQEAKYGNCVFVGYDREKSPKYCSMRAARTESNFKQDKENSDKSYPFYVEGKNDTVIVSESPIDLMSHATLAKMHGLDWKQDHRLSLGCTWDGALERYMKDHPEIKKNVFVLDNDYNARDKDGKRAPNYGQVAAEKYCEKYGEQGYACDIHRPHLKTSTRT